MNKKDYDISGNRITPYRTIHKSLKRNMKSVKNKNGFYELWKKELTHIFKNNQTFERWVKVK
tara:strand:- start:689 stop:874 length:186 start_codon:yes stop_codon:yes gene_type:complete